MAKAASQGNRRAKISRIVQSLLAFSVVLDFIAGTQQAFSQTEESAKKGIQLKKEGITAYIVRDESLDGIKLTMLIGHNSKLSQRIRKMVGRDVIPLIFSVSTLPGQSTYFTPLALEFVQDGKAWRPDSSALDSVIIMLEEKGKFGGVLEGGQTHQAVLLLPEWFHANKPIYIRYREQNDANLQLTQSLNGS